MPYAEKLSLESADHAARAAEIYGLVDGALAAHPAWSKVTDGYTDNTNFDAMDVWENDGTTDGYQWYLMVGQGKASDSKHQGRVALGGALEYDPATNVAKKALRGYNQARYVDADGYPLASAGGAETDFPLNDFYIDNYGSPTRGNIGGGLVPATAAGQWVRVLVTGQAAWIGWGTPTTLAWSHAVGTYTNMHSATADQKPLAFHVVNSSTGPTTVWQHPDATDSTTSRSNIQHYSSSSFMVSAASALYGEVGATVDLLHGGPVGSRLAVQRYYATSRESPTSYMSTAGGFLGLSPKEFLVFDRAAGCQIGDTVTVDGRAYVSVDSPSSKPSLFVCTEPEA